MGFKKPFKRGAPIENIVSSATDLYELLLDGFYAGIFDDAPIYREDIVRLLMRINVTEVVESDQF